MRDWMRLLIFGAVVATIMMTIAPPARPASDGPVITQAPSATEDEPEAEQEAAETLGRGL